MDPNPTESLYQHMMTDPETRLYQKAAVAYMAKSRHNWDRRPRVRNYAWLTPEFFRAKVIAAYSRHCINMALAAEERARPNTYTEPPPPASYSTEVLRQNLLFQIVNTRRHLR